MNKSVSLYAPKDRTFSTTKSLLTRVSIAGVVQGTTNHQVWKGIFDEVGLPLDELLKAKGDKNKRKATKQSKLHRSRRKHEVLKIALKDDTNAQREGTKCESGIAMRQFVRQVKSSMSNEHHNPKETP